MLTPLPTLPKKASDEFIRVKSGEAALLCVIGPADFHWEEFDPHTNRSVVMPEGQGKLKITVPIVQQTPQSMTLKKWKMSRMLYERLLQLEAAYSPITDYWVKLSRTGDGMKDTKWYVDPFPNNRVTEEQRAAIARLKDDIPF